MPVRSFTDAEVFVTERRRLEQPLVVMVWLGIALFALAGRSPYFLIAGTVAAGIKLQAVSRGKELFLRRALVNIGVLLATIVVITALIMRVGDPELSLGHYAILIQLCKLFERSRNRDYVQILVLSLLTVMTACLFSDQLWFALAVGSYLVLACHTAMILTLKRGLDSAAEAHLATEAGPLPAHKVAWNVRRDWPGKPLRWQLPPILVFMVAMGALFFVAAPGARITPGIAPRSEKSSAVAGYSGEVQLGDAKTVYLSDHVALKVRLTASDEKSARLGPLYLRGHVLEGYANNHWYPRRSPRTGETNSPAGAIPRPAAPVPGTIRQEISEGRSLLPTLFAMHPLRGAWMGEGSGPITVSPTGEMRVAPRTVPYSEWVDYVADSWTSPEAEVRSPPPWGPQAGESSLSPTSEVDATPPVRELARQWCRDLLDRRRTEPNRLEQIDQAIANRIANNLRSEYQYSLDLSGCDPDRDGVEDFLFHMKQGHCEYFASAMTVMCRALGVPARLATGFRTDDARADGRWVPVRDRDGHAWTEVYLPSKGWVIVDATPGGMPQPVPRRWWDFFSGAWDDAHQFWLQRIVRYSEQDRRYLLEQVRSAVRSAYQTLARIANDVLDGLNKFFLSGLMDEAVVDLVVALGASACIVELLIVFRVIRRKTLISRTLRGALGERWKQALFLVRLLKLLERKGLPRRPEATVEEAVLGGAAELHLPEGEARGLVQLYYRLRWGREDLPAAEIASAEATVVQWARTARKTRA